MAAVKKSRLEDTPTEILTEIFLYSMNFELPATSIHLALKLSDAPVYKKTINLAFTPTWNAWVAHSDKFPFPAGHPSVNINQGTSLPPSTDRAGDYVLQVRYYELTNKDPLTDYT